jgi:hypothetical protein
VVAPAAVLQARRRNAALEAVKRFAITLPLPHRLHRSRFTNELIGSMGLRKFRNLRASISLLIGLADCCPAAKSRPKQLVNLLL